jgi:hypothetical protein
MIIKKMDSKQEEIAELTALLEGKLIPYQGTYGQGRGRTDRDVVEN